MSATTSALTGEEREVALSEVNAVRALAQDGSYRETLEELALSLEEGDPLREELAGELDRLITLTLQSGRGRALYGPGGEQALLRTFRKLPSGAELSASAREVTTALSSLAGGTLDQVTVTAAGPGAFTVGLVVDGAELNLRLDRQGVRLASVAL